MPKNSRGVHGGNYLQKGYCVMQPVEMESGLLFFEEARPTCWLELERGRAWKLQKSDMEAHMER